MHHTTTKETNTMPTTNPPTWHPDRDGYGTVVAGESTNGSYTILVNGGITFADAVKQYGAVEAGELPTVIEYREETEAEERFGMSWDLTTASDVGVHLTCSEAEAFAALLRHLNMGELAAALLDGHGEGDDDPDDEHYTADNDR
jgi:hypothetical protein